MAELITPEEQITLPPPAVEDFDDSSSNLNPGEYTISKSRTSSLGKMFQKMRLSEVRAKLKKEGSSKEKMSDEVSKITNDVVDNGFSSSESIDGADKQEAKSEHADKASVRTNTSE